MGFDRLNPGEAHYRAKLTLRSISFAIGVGALIAGAYAWRVGPFLLIPICLSFIWNLANIIRRTTAATPIHPGANVGVDLIIWLIFLIITPLTTIFATGLNFASSVSIALNNTTVDGNCTTTTTKDDDGNTSTTTSCGALNGIPFTTLRSYSRGSLAACAFSVILLVLHFVLFVIACVDTHRRRRERLVQAAAYAKNEFAPARA
jgi:hypothetical protein